MGLKIGKVADELQDFYQEIAVHNRSRYKDWREWSHLLVDLISAFLDMNYTLSHVIVYGAAGYVAFQLVAWVLAVFS